MKLNMGRNIGFVSLVLFCVGVCMTGGSLALENGSSIKQFLLLWFTIDLQGFPEHLWMRIVWSLRWGILAAGLTCIGASLWWNTLRSRLIDRPVHTGVARDLSTRACVLFVGCAVVYVLVATVSFKGYPLTPDEFAYLYQAKLFARGHMTAQCHPLQEFFKSAFIAEHNGKLFSIMPTGWSLLLAPAVFLGIPWIVSPLCTAGAVALAFYLGSTIYSARTGWLAALLMAVSPFVVANAGTYLSHQASLVFFMWFLFFFLRIEQGKGRTHHYILMAIVLAALVLLHELDVAVCAPCVAMLLYWSIKGDSRCSWRRTIPTLLLAGGLVLGCTALRNKALTGSPWLLPFQTYVDDENFLSRNFVQTPPIGIYSAAVLKERTMWTIKRLGLLNVWLFPLAPVLFFILPLTQSDRRQWDLLFLASMGALWVTYMFYNSWGGIQFGPRYYLVTVGIASILIAESVQRIAAWWMGKLTTTMSLFLALSLVYSIGLSAAVLRFLPEVVAYVRTIQDVGSHLEKHNIHHALVFLSLSDTDAGADPSRIYLRVRNDPDFVDENLAAIDRGQDNGRLMDFYPDRSYFRYVIDIGRLLRGEPMEMTELPQSGHHNSSRTIGASTDRRSDGVNRISRF